MCCIVNSLDYLPSEPLDDPKILIITGSGISAESGLKTYRAEDGLWENEKIDIVCNEYSWQENYQAVHAFYNSLRTRLEEANPNPAHYLIAQIQQEYGDNVSIVTQNIDDLLERAGCKNVMHLHGSLTELECRSCSNIWNIGYKLVDYQSSCPFCNATNQLKPHIVFFGGHAPMYKPFYDLIDQMYHPQSFIVISGTSGAVIPVNELIKDLPSIKLLNNLEASEWIDGKQFDKVFYQPASTAWSNIKNYIDENVDWIS